MLFIQVPCAGPCPSASFCSVDTLNALLLFLDAVALISVCPSRCFSCACSYWAVCARLLLHTIPAVLFTYLSREHSENPPSMDHISLQLCGLSTQYGVWTRLDQLNIFENEVGPCHCMCEELYSLQGTVTVSSTRLQGGFWEMAVVTCDLSDNSHKVAASLF